MSSCKVTRRDKDMNFTKSYKVLQVYSDQSLHSICRAPKYSVEYAIDIWTLPRVCGTKLYVFDKIDSAVKFIKFISNNHPHALIPGFPLYECLAMDTNKCNKILDPAVLYINPSDINIVSSLNFIFPPDGTLECKAVKLLKQILF